MENRMEIIITQKTPIKENPAILSITTTVNGKKPNKMKVECRSIKEATFMAVDVLLIDKQTEFEYLLGKVLETTPSDLSNLFK